MRLLAFIVMFWLAACSAFAAGPVLTTPGQAYSWGYTNQITARDSALLLMTNTVQMSSKASNWELGLHSDGRLQAWGVNDHGQTNVPTETDYKFSCGGWDSGAAIRSNGLVVVWGNTNTWTTFSPTPVTDAKEVSLGDGHCAVLHSNGSVTVPYGWRSDVLNLVPSIASSNVAHIDSTWYAVVCLTSNGNVFSWGDASEPGSSLAGPSALYTNGIAKIGCGFFQLSSVDSNGVLRCWGTRNQYGETNVPAGFSNCTMVAAGAYHTIAIDGNSHMWAWGRNDQGQCNLSNPPMAGFVYAGYFNSGAIAGTNLWNGPAAPAPFTLNVSGSVRAGTLRSQ